MKPTRTVIIAAVILGLCSLAAGLWIYRGQDTPKQSPAVISTYEQCVAAGNPVQESDPPRCITKSGEVFTGPRGSTPTPPVAKPGKMTLTGNLSCLTKPGDGPQTLECAIALKTTEGKYYSLSTDSQELLAAGDRLVTVTGMLQPPQDNRYISEGILVVESYTIQ